MSIILALEHQGNDRTTVGERRNEWIEGNVKRSMNMVAKRNSSPGSYNYTSSETQVAHRPNAIGNIATPQYMYTTHSGVGSSVSFIRSTRSYNTYRFVKKFDSSTGKPESGPDVGINQKSSSNAVSVWSSVKNNSCSDLPGEGLNCH